MRTVLIFSSSLILVFFLSWTKWQQISVLMAHAQQSQEAGPQPESVAVATVQLQKIEQQFRTIGTVVPERGVAVSNPIAGQVTALNFESGAWVKKGEVVARLNTKVERAALHEAEARRRLAQKILKRNRPLVAGGVVSAGQMDVYEADLAQAEAEIARLRGQIELKVIRAPFKGRLGIRQVAIGEFLSPGTEIVSLQASSQMWVDFSVPQRFADELHDGARITAAWPGMTSKIHATIRAIAPNIAANTRTVAVRAQIDSNTLKGRRAELRPGMYVEVEWPRNTRELHVVPITALAQGPAGAAKLYFVEREGIAARVRERGVEVAQRFADRVAVLGDVHAGEEVVSQGVFKLYDGAPVVIAAQEGGFQ